MSKVKNFCGAAIAPTIVITLIFFINFCFFGMENTMIGPFVTLSFLRFRNMSDHYSCMLKTYLIYVTMTVLACFAVINLPLCILVNAGALFWLAYWLIDEYNPTNYFPAGMALIFFQIAPVRTPMLLFNRLAALSVSFLVMILFLFLLSGFRAQKHPLCGFIQQGLDLCKEKLQAFDDHDTTKLEFLHQKLCNINKQICDEIYSYNRASLRLTGKINWYCRYVALFQVVNFATMDLSDTRRANDIRPLLERFTRQFENRDPSSDHKRLKFYNVKPSRKAFRFRFAMRLALVITPCLAFAWLSGLENVYWLVISVFFMMIPIYENTRSRIRQRLLGTLAGILLCFVLFSLIQDLPGRILLMTLANFMIYGSSNYATMVIYITCSALAVQSIQSSVEIILLQRLMYTVIGGVIAFLGNKLIFPIHIRKEMRIIMQRLDEIRTRMTEISPDAYPDANERQYQTDQLVIKAYLLMKRLQTYHQMLPASQQRQDFLTYEKNYMGFMAAYLQENLIDKVPF